jgi:anion transporter
LVAAALFLSVAMRNTGLDRRIALAILARAGTRADRLLIGIIAVGAVLSLFIPSATARVACIAPIVLGIDRAVGSGRPGRLAALLMIATAHAGSLWNAGSKTAAAQNLVAVGVVQSLLGETLTWPQWFAAGAPLALLGSVGLYFVLKWLLPGEFAAVPGGSAAVAAARRALGPMSAAEKKLVAIALALLALWCTEKVLHPFDSAAVTVAAVTLLFMPGIAILAWRGAQSAIPWGTIALFGAGIGLGSALLKFKAAGWLAGEIVALAGLQQAPALQVLMVLSTFLVLLHLGFASAAALSSAMITIVIGVLQQVGTPAANLAGMTMLLQFMISFGFILPVNSPHNMLAYASETFPARDFIRTGVALTVMSLALQLLFALTYWHWLGYL